MIMTANMPPHEHVFSHFILLQYALLLLIIQFSFADQQLLKPLAEPTPKRVAVIGAGSAGSSTSYYLRKYAESSQIPVDITVYERASYIGGRSITVNVFDNPAYPIELGASIFVHANQVLTNASRDLGLTTQGADAARPKKADDSMGIWDGEQFVFTIQQNSSSWWNIGRILWRYGLSAIRAQSLMESTVATFLRLYEEPMFPFSSLSLAAEKLGLVNVTTASGGKFLKKNGVSEGFSREIIQASTRVNYGQNLGLIHGLESMVCLAAEGAVSIKGGNWQIFERMILSSGADIRLNATVTSIERNSDGTHTIKSSDSNNPSQESPSIFDEVVIAGPLQYSDLSIIPPLEHTPDEIPYVTLHVTLFSSPHRLSPKPFGLKDTDHTPETILTTLPQGLDLGNSTAGVGPAGFWSISTMRSVPAPSSSSSSSSSSSEDETKQHYVYKIFSPMPITASFVTQILDLNTTSTIHNSFPQAITDLPQTDISWSHEKTWHPYPFLYPRVTFEEPHAGPGIWYTGGMESFISTMETSALMGRNVAKLMVDKWQGWKGDGDDL